MPYRLVKGQFHLYYEGKRHVGAQPDGDSAWFKPDDPRHLEKLGGRSAKLNGGGCAQLRFEAIDALELHYQGSEQALAPALAARDSLLGQSLGFVSVEYSDNGLSARSAEPHPLPGYILTLSIDPYGRPVSFVFAGGTELPDGSDQFLSTEWLGLSANAALAESGHVYPAFYAGLPLDLRTLILRLTRDAAARGAGLWPLDLSTTGVEIPDLATLETLVLWPKLFRRLVSYFNGGADGLADFDDWLRADEERDDALWIVSEGRQENMHNVIEVDGDRLRMLYRPDDLVIVPR